MSRSALPPSDAPRPGSLLSEPDSKVRETPPLAQNLITAAREFGLFPGLSNAALLSKLLRVEQGNPASAIVRMARAMGLQTIPCPQGSASGAAKHLSFGRLVVVQGNAALPWQRAKKGQRRSHSILCKRLTPEGLFVVADPSEPRRDHFLSLDQLQKFSDPPLGGPMVALCRRPPNPSDNFEP